ncbi:TPA: olfactory receptor 447-like [Bos taurus]|nr:TPA: olfactory receptor 447-like [Bos taurus]
MEGNQTSVTEFILLGFPLNTSMQMLLFGLFSLFYVLTLLGNGVILGLISLDCRLHTPMYFFLSHLAIVDMAYTCSTVPQMLVNLLSPAKPISFAGCITQTFLFLSFAHTECLLLVVMSYDRYVAICYPLRYSVIMSWRVCITLAVTSWVFGVLLALVHLVLLLPLPFCGPYQINHFFCEIIAVLKLACADTHNNETMVLVGAVSVLVGPFSSIVVSYIHILCAILKIQSGEGRQKAFSTSFMCFRVKKYLTKTLAQILGAPYLQLFPFPNTPTTQFLALLYSVSPFLNTSIQQDCSFLLRFHFYGHRFENASQN